MPRSTCCWDETTTQDRVQVDEGMAMRIVVISDTHGMHEQVSLPDGDVLVHAGDFTARGALKEVAEFNRYLGRLPHRHKIVIAGNHELCLERDAGRAEKLLTDCIYLRDSSVVLEGIRFYGSPWQPWFLDWAFNLQRGAPLREKWQLIDEDTDVLITHGPPFGHCDQLYSGEHVGCEELIGFVGKIRPALHLFGHIHEAYGISTSRHTRFVNASLCNLSYEPVNKPVVIDL